MILFKNTEFNQILVSSNADALGKSILHNSRLFRHPVHYVTYIVLHDSFSITARQKYNLLYTKFHLFEILIIENSKDKEKIYDILSFFSEYLVY